MSASLPSHPDPLPTGTRFATQQAIGGAPARQEVWRSTVKVKRCRYLEASKCKGTCINLCKLPTEAFFREDLGGFEGRRSGGKWVQFEGCRQLNLPPIGLVGGSDLADRLCLHHELLEIRIWQEGRKLIRHSAFKHSLRTSSGRGQITSIGINSAVIRAAGE